MKQILLNTFAIFLMISLAFCLSSCDDDFEDPNLDFSNTTPAYVELADDALSADVDTTLSNGMIVNAETGNPVENEVVSTSVQLREARDNDVTVDYSVSGDITETASVVIPVGELSAEISVDVPFTASLNGSASLQLDGVSDGLTLGRVNVDVDVVSTSITWSAN